MASHINKRAICSHWLLCGLQRRRVPVETAWSALTSRCLQKGYCLWSQAYPVLMHTKNDLDQRDTDGHSFHKFTDFEMR